MNYKQAVLHYNCFKNFRMNMLIIHKVLALGKDSLWKSLLTHHADSLLSTTKHQTLESNHRATRWVVWSWWTVPLHSPKRRRTLRRYLSRHQWAWRRSAITKSGRRSKSWGWSRRRWTRRSIHWSNTTRRRSLEKWDEKYQQKFVAGCFKYPKCSSKELYLTK